MRKLLSILAGAVAALGFKSNDVPWAPKRAVKGMDASMARFLRRRFSRGKSRGYRKRPQLYISRFGAISRNAQPGSKAISYRNARLHRITESQRQAIGIAKTRRDGYVARRSARWKKLVEAELPKQFAAKMQKLGLGMELGSGMAAEQLA